MRLWRRFADGYEAGLADARVFIDAERRISEASIKHLEFELARAHDDFIDVNRRCVEATERADMACDRLLEVYGREGISHAYARARARDDGSRLALAKATSFDPLAPVPYGPDCHFANEDEARGEYA